MTHLREIARTLMVIVCVSHKCNKTGQFHRNSSDVSSFRKPFPTDQYLSFLNRVKRGGRLLKEDHDFLLHYSFAKMHMACKSACSALPLWSPKIEKKKERDRENGGDLKNAKKDLRLLRKKGHEWGRKQAFSRATAKIAGNRRGDVSICGWPVVRSDSEVKGTVCSKTVIRIFSVFIMVTSYHNRSFVGPVSLLIISNNNIVAFVLFSFFFFFHLNEDLSKFVELIFQRVNVFIHFIIMLLWKWYIFKISWIILKKKFQNSDIFDIIDVIIKNKFLI